MTVCEFLKTLVPAALVAAGTFCSCSVKPEDVPGPEPAAPEISVSKSVLSVSSDGGEIAVSYSLLNAGDGASVQAGTEDDWLHVAEITAESVVLSVDANTGDSDRISTVTLSFSGADDAFVVVMQGRSAQENDERFDIRVSGVTSAGADVQISPVGKEATWLYGIVLKSDYDSMGPQGYVDARIEQIRSMMQFGDMAFRDFLAAGDLSHSPSSLNDDTEYYVTAFDLTADAKSSGRVALKRFRTLAAAASSCTFEVKMNGGMLNVVPSMGGETYLCDVISSELWDSYASPRDVAQDYVSALKSYGYLSIYLCRGSYSEDYSDFLVKGRDYVAYAFGYRYVDGGAAGSGITTAIYSVRFTY